jgi:sugar lactone lactonase YvrE
MRRIYCWFLLMLTAMAWVAIGQFRLAQAATLYVANADDGSIVTVDPTGSVHPFVSNAMAGNMTFDAAGILYTSQYNSGGLIKVTSSGTQIPLASGFSSPAGVAVDGGNNVFVAEFNATVAKVTPGGQVSTFATGGQLKRPTDLAFDSTGTLTFCDYNSTSVGRIAANGAVTIVASGLGNTQAIALDGNDNIFVSDISNHAIYKVTQAGTVSVFEMGLQNVQGLAYDRQAGLLYASDRATNAIYKVAQGGQATLFASGFGSPVGIAFSPAVPEPASIVLCITGTAGLFCVVRRRKKTGRIVIVCLMPFVSMLCLSARAANLPAASFTSGPTTVGHTGQNGNSSHTLGWTFSTNNNLLVTSFGYYDDGSDGLLEAHNVGIFDNSGTLLSSMLVPSGLSATLVAKFRYEPVTPFLLVAGNTYTIGGTIGADASDPVAYDVAGLASIPAIAIPSGASRFTESGSYTDLNYPTSSYPPGNPYNVYFGPNFEAQSVPEPASIALVILGLLSLLTCFRSSVQRISVSPHPGQLRRRC